VGQENLQLARFKFEVKVVLQLTVIRPVCLGVRHPSGAHDEMFVTLSSASLDVVHPFRPKKKFIAYNCRWSRHSSHSWIRVPRDSQTYFIVSGRDSPNLQAVEQFHPTDLVSSYDPPGCDILSIRPTSTRLSFSVEIEVTLRLTASQSVCLGIEHPCGTCDQMLLPA
jgi:hypothetical protein